MRTPHKGMPHQAADYHGIRGAPMTKITEDNWDPVIHGYCTPMTPAPPHQKLKQKERKFPFDEWQKKQCSYCQVTQPCEQVKFNFRDYQKGELTLKRGCPWRQDP